MPRFPIAILALLLSLLPLPAAAQVTLSFHSFSGSWLIGRYPHTFIVLEGALDETGAPVFENYGFSAVTASPAVLSGSVRGKIHIEPEKYVRSTNRHFSVPVTDAQYHAIIAEMRLWRDAPGRSYNLDQKNCVHFVARVAALVGLNAEVPQTMVRRPKRWLNFLTRINPQLGAKEIP